MEFDKSELAKVARLARIAIDDGEVEHFRKDLARIVTYIEQLNNVDIDNIEPMIHAHGQHLSFREDIAHEVLGRKCIEGSAGYEDGLVSVPKIIE
jgi:aspartyl-tRNA(Asn)/glutamyl-tRNA(Gln) amidotransferase subunit C